MKSLQRRSDNSLRHLLTLDGVSAGELVALLGKAEAILDGTAQYQDSLRGKSVANLFFESSTRTRVSFELAAHRLGANVINLDIDTSSRNKGESIADTVATLSAMEIDALIIRHAETGIPGLVANNCDNQVTVINAGESTVSHPTQGLLDLLTIRRHKSAFENLVVAIAGDVKHSRVAASAIQGLKTLGVGEIRLIGPESLLPDPGRGMVHYHDMDKGVADCDVIMMLRIQFERMKASVSPDASVYREQFGLTAARLRLAKPDAIVMHPGPMNRDVEIESAVADGEQSVIREQVRNGVAVRMAVLHSLLVQENTT